MAGLHLATNGGGLMFTDPDRCPARGIVRPVAPGSNVINLRPAAKGRPYDAALDEPVAVTLTVEDLGVILAALDEYGGCHGLSAEIRRQIRDVNDDRTARADAHDDAMTEAMTGGRR